MWRRWVALGLLALFASCQGIATNDHASDSVESALDPTLPPDVFEDVVVPTEGHPGSTQGGLSVSHTGSAHYSIPIAIPPGRTGMTPLLSLEYSSEGTDGLFGVGWSLSVLSLVHRCPRDRAHDGETDGLDWTTASPWCLDGQRYEDVLDEDGIIDWAVVGDEHHLRTRDGRLLVYGGTGARWVGAGTGGSGQPFGYALRLMEDRAGNSIAFSYTQSPNGQLRPAEIRYTDHPSHPASAKVVFVYEERSHVVPRFIDGRAFANDGRVSRIESWLLRAPGAHGVLAPLKVWEHRLTYGNSPFTKRSLLEAVQHCDRAGVCRTPIEFEYSGDALPYGADFSYGTGVALDWNFPLTVVGDVSGDGQDDLVGNVVGGPPGADVITLHGSPEAGPEDPWYAVQTDIPLNWAVDAFDYDGDGRGEILANEPLAPPPSVRGSIRELVPMFAGGALTEFVMGPVIAYGGVGANRLGYGLIDLDGDGVPDFGTHQADGVSGVDNIGFQVNGGFAPWGSYTYASSHMLDEPHEIRRRAMFVDLLGDGRTEVIFREEHYDDMDALLWTGHSVVGMESGGTIETPATLPLPDTPKQVFLDMNGDGLPDLLELLAAGYAGFTVRYNTGASLEPPHAALGAHPVWWTVESEGGRNLNAVETGFNPEDVLVGDFNRDGMDDFVLLAHDESPSSTFDINTRYEDEHGEWQPCYWQSSHEARMAVHISNGRTFDVVEVRPAGRRTMRTLHDPTGSPPPHGHEGCVEPNGWGYSVLADVLGSDGLMEVTYAGPSGGGGGPSFASTRSCRIFPIACGASSAITLRWRRSSTARCAGPIAQKSWFPASTTTRPRPTASIRSDA